MLLRLLLFGGQQSGAAAAGEADGVVEVLDLVSESEGEEEGEQQQQQLQEGFALTAVKQGRGRLVAPGSSRSRWSCEWFKVCQPGMCRPGLPDSK